MTNKGNSKRYLHNKVRDNGRNASFRIFLRWPIHIINPVNKTKLSCLEEGLDRTAYGAHYVHQIKNIKFHVAVRMLSNRSQMTSKRGKNNYVVHEAIAECVTDVLTTFWCLLWSITEQTHGNMESTCFISKKRMLMTSSVRLSKCENNLTCSIKSLAMYVSPSAKMNAS